MSNMGYCRFENTASDLRDCKEWLSDNEPSTLGPEEFKAFKRLVKMCKQIAEDYEDDA